MSEPHANLTLREIASMLDSAVRNGTWKAEPLGQEVQRFLLYLRGARDASQRTIDDYQSVLARFVAEHAHLELADFEGALGAERVLEFVSRHWGAAAPGTRRKVLSIFAPSSPGRPASTGSSPTRCGSLTGHAARAWSATPTRSRR
jgi:hypothetical protein